MTDRIGPTGEFPRGKLNADDEGALNVAFSTESGNVRIDFGKDLSWIAFGPDEALAIASVLVARAMELKRGGA